MILIKVGKESLFGKTILELIQVSRERNAPKKKKEFDSEATKLPRQERVLDKLVKIDRSQEYASHLYRKIGFHKSTIIGRNNLLGSKAKQRLRTVCIRRRYRKGEKNNNPTQRKKYCLVIRSRKRDKNKKTGIESEIRGHQEI